MRPLLWPTVITVPALAVLLALGIWQLDRRDWKLGLIEAVETRTGAEPVDLDLREGLQDDRALAEWEYRPVRLEGEFDHAAEIHVFTSLPDPKGPFGGPGYWIMTPLITDQGAVFVNRGFVPADRKNPESRPDGQVTGALTVVGLLRRSQEPSWFTDVRDPDGEVWYARDVAAMRRFLGSDGTGDFFVDSSTPVPGGLPQAGETRVTFRNEHLDYALTWFGLAIALLIIYFAFHAKRGRLGPTRKRRDGEPGVGVH